MMEGFSSSYHPDDVIFLLKTIHMEPVSFEEKERLLQSGERHYSELIGVEEPPDADYMAQFHAALALNIGRLAGDIAVLARALAAGRPAPVLVSLARAGTPVGVHLRRALRRLGVDAPHYSISIIRERGLDFCALDWLVQRYPPESLVFVDGWTGKGGIAEELRRSVAAYAKPRGLSIDPGLVVLSDLSGVAALAATDEDYLIPSAILNAVISGLVSRTILHKDHVGPGEFHACVVYDALASQDLSRWYVDRVDEAVALALAAPPRPLPALNRARARDQMRDFIERSQRVYGVSSAGFIKPGIGEATRALLRRVPERLLLQAPDASDSVHLRLLAERRGVPCVADPALPYRAVVLVRRMAQDGG